MFGRGLVLLFPLLGCSPDGFAPTSVACDPVGSWFQRVDGYVYYEFPVVGWLRADGRTEWFRTIFRFGFAVRDAYEVLLLVSFVPCAGPSRWRQQRGRDSSEVGVTVDGRGEVEADIGTDRTTDQLTSLRTIASEGPRWCATKISNLAVFKSGGNTTRSHHTQARTARISIRSSMNSPSNTEPLPSQPGQAPAGPRLSRNQTPTAPITETEEARRREDQLVQHIRQLQARGRSPGSVLDHRAGRVYHGIYRSVNMPMSVDEFLATFRCPEADRFAAISDVVPTGRSRSPRADAWIARWKHSPCQERTGCPTDSPFLRVPTEAAYVRRLWEILEPHRHAVDGGDGHACMDYVAFTLPIGRLFWLNRQRWGDFAADDARMRTRRDGSFATTFNAEYWNVPTARRRHLYPQWYPQWQVLEAPRFLCVPTPAVYYYFGRWAMPKSDGSYAPRARIVDQIAVSEFAAMTLLLWLHTARYGVTWAAKCNDGRLFAQHYPTFPPGRLFGLQPQLWDEILRLDMPAVLEGSGFSVADVEACFAQMSRNRWLMDRDFAFFDWSSRRILDVDARWAIHAGNYNAEVLLPSELRYGDGPSVPRSVCSTKRADPSFTRWDDILANGLGRRETEPEPGPKPEGLPPFPPMDDSFRLPPNVSDPQGGGLPQGGDPPSNAGPSVVVNSQAGNNVPPGNGSGDGPRIRSAPVPDEVVLGAAVEASQNIVESGATDAENQAVGILRRVVAAFLHRHEGQSLRDARARVDGAANRIARAVVAYLAKEVGSVAERVKAERDAATVLTTLVRSYLDRSVNGHGDGGAN